jgi:hypothetical protein
VKDKLASLQTSEANTSFHSFSDDIGMKSTGDVSNGQFLTTLSVSLSAIGWDCCSNSGADLGTDAEIVELQ